MHLIFDMLTKFCILIYSHITCHCVFDKICSWYSCLVCTYWRCCGQCFSIYFLMVIHLCSKNNSTQIRVHEGNNSNIFYTSGLLGNKSQIMKSKTKLYREM